jgi:hypothetical protein
MPLPTRMMFSTMADQPTQYGQSKFDFNGIKYTKGPNYGHTIAMNAEQSYIDFTANGIWDNPGARRVKK